MPTEFARAKVNLFLHVTGKRADGFHLLDSLAVFPAVGDRLSLTLANALDITVTGPFGDGLAAEPNNLVLRAARGFGAAMGREVDFAFRLTKNLPVASGIGGGSADAAAALRLLARHWNCPIPDFLAEPLGADVPVCIVSRPARMGGIGEILSAAPRLPEFGMVLVNPGVAVATPAIFKARGGGFSPMADLPSGWDDAVAMAADLARLSNDLEVPALGMAPVIGTVLAALRADPACLLARMSGSGATCFGIFADADAAAAACATANLARPGWWCWGGAGTGKAD
ncbi:MAG: 4-(cytidine 5'-diphospho)-2-C-methyl-D-erythritol kinase [Acidiphilium sp.]|nr:4-(cytidine 5'-diphospho)-2-C-methyl-D-erythritol kinase [Acidiphilium sp.]MDD4937207.1 4-(cytidine 5'-diphospho)-2-C-methyl-D-erythritol kinase [Acidiphilium sp.]